VCARHMHNGKPEDDEKTGLSEFHTLFPSKTLFALGILNGKSSVEMLKQNEQLRIIAWSGPF